MLVSHSDFDEMMNFYWIENSLSFKISFALRVLIEIYLKNFHPHGYGGVGCV